MLRAALLLAIVVAGPAAAAGPAWLQYASGGGLVARVVADGQCPMIRIDGRDAPMTPRGTPPPGHRLACEHDVSNGVMIAIGATSIKVPKVTPARIVVIGDTGCRIKVAAPSSGDVDDDDDDDETVPGIKPKVQDCNDRAQWPFETVARSAAAAKPDLIVHVGDYVYRESTCPPDFAADCAGSPVGDQWATWDADFFTPAQAALATAPWIFVRGNHEICGRAGVGWFYYLGPGPYDAAHPCSEIVASYPVWIGDFQALVLDSSDAPDEGPSPTQVDAFARQLGAATALEHAWLLSHRPIWAAKAGQKGDRADLRTLNATLGQAWAKDPGAVAGIDLIVSGHAHLFELVTVDGVEPTQVVVGNSGTKLAHPIKKKTPLPGTRVGTRTISSGISDNDFGFVVLEPQQANAGWKLRLHGIDGSEILRCKVGRGKSTCG